MELCKIKGEFYAGFSQKTVIANLINYIEQLELRVKELENGATSSN